jgi:hypothetical protein
MNNLPDNGMPGRYVVQKSGACSVKVFKLRRPRSYEDSLSNLLGTLDVSRPIADAGVGVRREARAEAGGGEDEMELAEPPIPPPPPPSPPPPPAAAAAALTPRVESAASGKKHQGKQLRNYITHEGKQLYLGSGTKEQNAALREEARR